MDWNRIKKNPCKNQAPRRQWNPHDLMMNEAVESCKCQTDLGSEAILAIGLCENVHHFVEGRNVKVQDGAVVHQSVYYWCGGTEQLELNIVVVCPAIEKREHSQAPAADCLHGGKIQCDDAGIGLFLYNIAKLENRFATNDPAPTLDYCEVVQVLNAYGQHRILRLLYHFYFHCKNRAGASGFIFQPDTTQRSFEAENIREVVGKCVPTENPVPARLKLTSAGSITIGGIEELTWL